MNGKLFLITGLTILSWHLQAQVYQQPTYCYCKKNRITDTIAVANQTKKIVIISFKSWVLITEYPHPTSKKYSYETRRRINIWDWQNNTLVISLESSLIQEKRELTLTETASLFNIFYGYIKDPVEPALMEEIVSYNPDHGIIFYDATDSPFAYYEVCFECKKAFGSQGAYFGDMCEGKMVLLKDFFKSVGWYYKLD